MAGERALVSLGWEVDTDKSRRTEGILVTESRRLEKFEDFGLYAEGLRHRLYLVLKQDADGKSSVAVRREVYREKRVLWHTERTVVPHPDASVELAVVDAIRQSL